MRTPLLALCVFVLSSQSGVADHDGVPVYIQAGGLVVTQVEGTNTFAAYSAKSGKWATHTFPDAVKAVPVLTKHCIAFQLSGKQVAELVAVDEVGKWHTHKLPDPTDNGCIPVVHERLAFCVVDGRVHAFSGVTGHWDSIRTAASVPPVFNVASTTNEHEVLLLAVPGSLSAFSPRHATWSTISTKSPE